jgi:hypothetical protein
MNSFDLDKLLGDFAELAEAYEEREGIWREEPLDLFAFCKEYLDITPYEGKQTEIFQKINDVVMWKITLDDRYADAADQNLTELLLMLGKGSGKDYMLSAVFCWISYLLNCLNNPQETLGLAEGEPIDLINIANNTHQANEVFFYKFKQRLAKCKFFKRVDREPRTPYEYQPMRSMIRFFNDIKAHSTHADAETLEGVNPWVVVFDEISGIPYEQADKVYDTFSSSAATRYNDRMLLLFISFPRHQGDFLYVKFRKWEQEDTPHIWGIKGKSWEVNPKVSRASLQKFYDKNPEDARMRYECIAPEAEAGFFEFPEKIDYVVVPGKIAQCPDVVIQPKVTTRMLKNETEVHFVGLDIFNLQLNPDYTYYLGGDGGVTTDSYVLCLMHGEQTIKQETVNGEIVTTVVNKPVEDLLIEWRPNKKERLPVDLMNVAEVIEMICNQVYVKKALFDKFNSADITQRLISLGVDAEDKNFSNQFQVEIYKNLRSLIYTQNIELLDHQITDGSERLNANEELKKLKIINDSKIDHDKRYGKDFSDARAAATWICSMDEPESESHAADVGLFGAVRGLRA